MSAPTGVVEKSEYRRCGCCGRQLPAGHVVELGVTPGVFICAGCAIWAARRAGPLSALRQVRVPLLRLLLRRWRRPAGPGAVLAIPILRSADLDGTAGFYAVVGFTEAARYEGYLLLRNGPVELHFAQPGASAPGECFIHVGDALMLWKQLRHHGVNGVGPVADQDYGLREFVLTDPDGNRVRIGSRVP
jgi:hypothetical protein